MSLFRKHTKRYGYLGLGLRINSRSILDPYVSLKASILGYWKLGEATSAARNDSSPNGKTLTNNNNCTQVAGKIGNGTGFVAASSQLLSATWGLAGFGSSRSVALWVKPHLLSGIDRGIASVGTTSKDGIPLWLLVQKSTNVFAIDHAGAYRLGSTTIIADTWYHVAYTFNATTNAFTLYVNGFVEASGTAADISGKNNGNLFLGDGFNANFDGSLDAAGIWSRALAATEVATLYNGGNGVEIY